MTEGVGSPMNVNTPKNYLILAFTSVLVLAQFALAAAIVLSTRWSNTPSAWMGLLAVVLIVIGSGVAVWAWWVMGVRKLRVMPHPAKEANLLRHGPYRSIRHPMYSGLLIASLGCIVWDAGTARGLLWLGLLCALIAKTQIEELLLTEKFTDYPQYQSQSWRFLPGVW